MIRGIQYQHESARGTALIGGPQSTHTCRGLLSCPHHNWAPVGERPVGESTLVRTGGGLHCNRSAVIATGPLNILPEQTTGAGKPPHLALHGYNLLDKTQETRSQVAKLGLLSASASGGLDSGVGFRSCTVQYSHTAQLVDHGVPAWRQEFC